MADFIEVLSGFTLTKALADDGWTGTRVFKQCDSPSATQLAQIIAEAALPDTGDAWPAAFDFGLTIPANLVVRDIDYDLEGGDFTLNNMRTYKYSTQDQSKDNQPDNNTDSEGINITGFFRQVPFSKAANANKLVNAAGEPLMKITVLEVRAIYTKVEVGYSTFALAVASGSPTGKVLTTNNNWLSLGTNVSQYEVEGNAKWRASRSYSYKKIVSPDAHITDDTWQADWFPKAAKFDVATTNLYPEAAFVDTMPTIL